jgi:hypothetical protein
MTALACRAFLFSREVWALHSVRLRGNIVSRLPVAIPNDIFPITPMNKTAGDIFLIPRIPVLVCGLVWQEYIDKAWLFSIGGMKCLYDFWNL